MKYIFVTGGVMSGIGKGITTSSIGKVLQSKGFEVTALKIDPYVNVDAGTMNPVEHGEVFVTDDGTECDQDIGNYERFLDRNIYDINYMTTGRVYQTVIEKERNLEYKGKCVEVVPHIPEEVIRRIKKAGRTAKADFTLVEIGGTVGEYQNMLFLEAARMLHLRHPKDVLFVLVSYLPVPKMIGEMKTKPTQYAARTLNAAGIQPDLIIARSEIPLDEPRKKKISASCNIPEENVIPAPDVESIYEVPLNFERDKVSARILKKFKMRSRGSRGMKKWEELVKNIKNEKGREIKIGICGKYFATGNFVLSDSYLSVIEAVKHSCWNFRKQPKITWINSEEFEKTPAKIKSLEKLDGLIVPGGYGSRGVEGKLKAIEYARKNKIPFLGLCYGMQLAAVEFARHVCKMEKANTVEIDPKTPFPIIDIMEDQRAKMAKREYGGSMRLGAYPCRLKKGTRAAKAYGRVNVSERHRHRFEFNNEFKETLRKKGLIFSGTNPERNLVEIIELEDHPFFMGVQFHPELKSRPIRPHPLFKEFIRIASKR